MPIGHTLLTGLDLNYEAYQQELSRTGAQWHSSAGSVGCARRLHVGAGFRGTFRRCRAACIVTGLGLGACMNDTIQVMPWLKLVGGVRWDVYSAQIGNSINSVNTPGNTAVPYYTQTDTFTSVRSGAIFEPTKEQSYYVSYSTSFNPSLEQLTSTTGTTQLPPESNEGYEVGAKYELLNGNLSLNGALFQITKYNARTQNADGTFARQRPRAGRPRQFGRILPNGRCSATPTERPHPQGSTNINGISAPRATCRSTCRDSATSDHLRSGHLRDRRRRLLCRQRYQQPECVQVPGTRVDLTAAYKQPATRSPPSSTCSTMLRRPLGVGRRSCVRLGRHRPDR
jgi:catecholate siderophore receptor